jgi:hypothetical protein
MPYDDKLPLALDPNHPRLILPVEVDLLAVLMLNLPTVMLVLLLGWPL